MKNLVFSVANRFAALQLLLNGGGGNPMAEIARSYVIDTFTTTPAAGILTWDGNTEIYVNVVDANAFDLTTWYSLAAPGQAIILTDPDNVGFVLALIISNSVAAGVVHFTVTLVSAFASMIPGDRIALLFVPGGVSVTGPVTVGNLPTFNSFAGNLADSGIPSSTILDADLHVYAPGQPANWTGPPTIVADALDRLAAAVAGLLAGPIP